MNRHDSRDNLLALRDTLKKLERDPDHERPALAELKRLLEERIARLEKIEPAQ
jgi:hypothetical protein